MNERCWVWVATTDSIPPREGRAVVVAGHEFAIFHLGGDRFLATESHCPHKGGPLADGIVAGTSVVCPLHGWKIDLNTGGVARPAGETKCVETYPAMVDNGMVVVGLPASWFSTAMKAAV